MTCDSRGIVDVLSSNDRPHTVGADQRDATVSVAFLIEGGYTVVVLLDAFDSSRRQEFNLACFLRAFEQRQMHVDAVNHGVWIAKALTEDLPGRDLADLVFFDRVVHHH